MTGFPVEMGCPKFLKLESWELLPCGYGREGGCLERHRIRKAWVCVPALPLSSCVIIDKFLSLFPPQRKEINSTHIMSKQ
jgi:hypothetical protein